MLAEGSKAEPANADRGLMMTLQHYAIVEVVNPTQEQRISWAVCDRARVPLMQQKEFVQLQEEGPWLVTLDGQVDEELSILRKTLGDETIVSWLSSALPLHELGQHLSASLVAQIPDGSTVLLRSYSPQVLPFLHERRDSDWSQALFRPVNEWCVTLSEGVRCFAGTGSTVVPAHEPIMLDDLLIRKLAVDPQALALLDELEASAPDVFLSDCHGDRYAQVSHALEQGRQIGLQRAEDQVLFAALTLLDSTPLDQTVLWPSANRLIAEGFSLGEALELIVDEQTT